MRYLYSAIVCHYEAADIRCQWRNDWRSDWEAETHLEFKLQMSVMGIRLLGVAQFLTRQYVNFVGTRLTRDGILGRDDVAGYGVCTSLLLALKQAQLKRA